MKVGPTNVSNVRLGVEPWTDVREALASEHIQLVCPYFEVALPSHMVSLLITLVGILLWIGKSIKWLQLYLKFTFGTAGHICSESAEYEM